MSPQDSLERLLENLIVMLGKTNERVIDLNRRVARLEERLPQEIYSSTQNPATQNSSESL